MLLYIFLNKWNKFGYHLVTKIITNVTIILLWISTWKNPYNRTVSTIVIYNNSCYNLNMILLCASSRDVNSKMKLLNWLQYKAA